MARKYSDKKKSRNTAGKMTRGMEGAREGGLSAASNQSVPSVKNEQMTQSWDGEMLWDGGDQRVQETPLAGSHSMRIVDEPVSGESESKPFEPINGECQDKRRIMALQAMLMQGGYYTGKLNGKYDSNTKAAVKKYQEKKNESDETGENKLEVTGEVDQATWDILNAEAGLSKGSAKESLGGNRYDSPQEKLVKYADFYNGYHEKTNAKDLNSKAGTGSGDYTRFGRDYSIIQGSDWSHSAWCQMFANMMMIEAFGEDAAKQMLGGEFFAAPAYAANQMAEMNKNYEGWNPEDITEFTDNRSGLWSGGNKTIKLLKTPEVGDFVFFCGSGSKADEFSHVGIVQSIDNEKGILMTIEGNYGQQVTSEISYKAVDGSFIGSSKGNNTIIGFARPDWSLVHEEEEPVSNTPKRAMWSFYKAGKNQSSDGTGESLRPPQSTVPQKKKSVPTIEQTASPVIHVDGGTLDEVEVKSTPIDLLSKDKSEEAIEWNKDRHYTTDCIDHIQAFVGVEHSGDFDDPTVQSLARWQKKAGITVDGKFGNDSSKHSKIKREKLDVEVISGFEPEVITALNPETITHIVPSEEVEADPAKAPQTEAARTETISEGTGQTKIVMTDTKFSKDVVKTLTDHAAGKALAWYIDIKITPELLKKIQGIVGVAQTGVLDVAFVHAVGQWQTDNKVGKDGRFGPKSAEKSGDKALSEALSKLTGAYDKVKEKECTTYEKITGGATKLKEMMVEGEYPFINIPPYDNNPSYDYRFKQLSELEVTSDIKVTPDDLGKEDDVLKASKKLSAEIPEGNSYTCSDTSCLGYVHHNPCNISVPSTNFGCTGKTKSGKQNDYAIFDTIENGLASTMWLLRDRYNNQSIRGMNDKYQGRYNPNEEVGLSLLRLYWIANNAKQLACNPTEDKFDLDDKNTLFSLVHSIAIRESGTTLQRDLLEKAYRIAFPGES